MIRPKQMAYPTCPSRHTEVCLSRINCDGLILWNWKYSKSMPTDTQKSKILRMRGRRPLHRYDDGVVAGGIFASQVLFKKLDIKADLRVEKAAKAFLKSRNTAKVYAESTYDDVPEVSRHFRHSHLIFFSSLDIIVWTWHFIKIWGSCSACWGPRGWCLL